MLALSLAILGAVSSFVGWLEPSSASLNEKTRPTTGPGESSKHSA
jgi:hypothetical protein